MAAVAATNPHVAEQALALIDVEYEVLPPVMDLRTATAPGATILHPAMRTQGVKDGDEPTNVASRFRFERGDVEGGLAAADVVVEREFATSAVHQGYIEPPTRSPRSMRCGRTGDDLVLDAGAVRRARHGRARARAVAVEGPRHPGRDRRRLRRQDDGLSRADRGSARAEVGTSGEDGHEPRRGAARVGADPGSRIRIRMGATRDGRITAADCWFAVRGGAFSGSPVGPVPWPRSRPTTGPRCASRVSTSW